MDEIVKEQDTLHTQLTSFQNLSEQLQQENQALKQEVYFYSFINQIFLRFRFYLKVKFKK